MSVEAIQCPKCGGPLTVEKGRDSVYCSHCGAGLRIATGSSGHPMATLADIKDDTSLLAMRAALERLDERLQERDNQLRQLETARAEACETEQQRQEQQQEKQRAKVSQLRSQLRVGASSERTLWTVALLCLVVGVFSICLSAVAITQRTDADYLVGSIAFAIVSLAAAGFLVAFGFSERAKQPKIVNLLESAVQDEAAPDSDSTNQKHKEALHRIDAELAAARSEIQGIETQRDTLRAKLDSLTDQL